MDQDLFKFLQAVEPDLAQLDGVGRQWLPQILAVARDKDVPIALRARASTLAAHLLRRDPHLVGRAEEVVKALASAPEAVLRRAGAELAGSVETPPAVAALKKLIDDKDAIVRHISANQLPVVSRAVSEDSGATDPDASRKLAPLPCAETPKARERLPRIVSVRAGASLLFRYWLCETRARLLVRVSGRKKRPLFNDYVFSRDGKPVEIPLTRLHRGKHYLLHWSFQDAGLRWSTRAELLVDGRCEFRHFKRSTGADPVNRGSLVLLIEDSKTRRRTKTSRVRKKKTGRRVSITGKRGNR